MEHIGGINRRDVMRNGLLTGIGLSLGGCAPSRGRPVAGLSVAGGLIPVRASPDRIFDITVCLRPFRAAGPRLDVEQMGDKRIVHNYGHGGSGWSLSWGSGTIAVAKAMESSPAEIAIVGCGALGLTAAVLAQRAGAKVTIYARELAPQTRSARATGTWSPDSRIALLSAAGPQFGVLWEEMAGTSFKTFRQYLGLPGDPVEWSDRYTISDTKMAFPRRPTERPGQLDFAHHNERIRDLAPRQQLVTGAASPFEAPFVYRSESMQFNIADYAHTLLAEFHAAGGKFQRMEFHTPADYARIREGTR